MTYDVGDTATLTLTVQPFDGTTAVAAAATSPAGVTTALPLDPGDEPGSWTASLLLTEPDDWRITWTVTGTGALVEHTTIQVAPTATGTQPGRVYATTTQLAEVLDELPANPRRALLRASRVIDRLLLTAVYGVDELGQPTDPDVAAALAEATCAQVEWWGEVGDTAGTGAVAALAGAQIGSVKLPGGGGAAGGVPEYAPDAISALRRAGLLQRGPRIAGARVVRESGFL